MRKDPAITYWHVNSEWGYVVWWACLGETAFQWLIHGHNSSKSARRMSKYLSADLNVPPFQHMNGLHGAHDRFPKLLPCALLKKNAGMRAFSW